ncbi:MAG: hypothetical protein OIF58_00900 [Cohaesibacter sp.]|nr:hypothetical protein [Cohaesibacter sp.]
MKNPHRSLDAGFSLSFASSQLALRQKKLECLGQSAKTNEKKFDPDHRGNPM